MSAGAIMIRRDSHAGRFGDQAEPGSRSRIGGHRALRLALLRLDPGIVVLVGFAAALGWAFVGSLLLGLGAGSASRVAAWLWLAGEALVGAALLGALLLGAPRGGGDDA